MLALALGLFVLGHELVAPVPPVTTGCLAVTFDTLRVPGDPTRRWVELGACPHFDRTEVDLTVHLQTDSTNRSGGGIFSGSTPGGPRDWPHHLRVQWRGPETLLVEHDAGVRFLSRWDTAAGIGIVYRPLETDSE